MELIQIKDLVNKTLENALKGALLTLDVTILQAAKNAVTDIEKGLDLLIQEDTNGYLYIVLAIIELDQQGKEVKYIEK